MRSREQLLEALGDRLAAAIPEASASEVKNLVDAWDKLAQGAGLSGDIVVRWASDDLEEMAK